MAQIAYVNGRYVHQRDAMVSIEDRGYQFSDGIYEYISFYNRRLLDGAPHLKRLEKSLKEIHIPMPMSLAAMEFVIKEVIARNSRDHGALYIQVTRGVAKRDHPFPAKPIKPSLVMTVSAAKFPKKYEMEDGVSVITHPEQRWARRDIKAVSLLPNVLAKQEATKQKVREAWLIEPGDVVTEGSVSNAFIVNAKGEIVTHPADHHILGGITRAAIIGLAKGAGLTVIEKPFTLTDVAKASEAFLTVTSAGILAVVNIDGKPIGSGKPGKVVRQLQSLYAAHIEKQTGFKWAF